MQFEATRTEETRLKMKLKEQDVKLWLTSHDLPVVNYINGIMPRIQYYLKKNKEVEVEQNMFRILDSKDKTSIKKGLIRLDDLKKVSYFISHEKINFQ